MTEKSKRGFASMDKNKQREIASKGGRAAHTKGTAHRFTSEEARVAGRKGGEAVSRNREHMAEIGRKGGEARSTNLTTVQSDETALKTEDVRGSDMNAIDMLKKDHKRVSELFQEFEAHHQINIAEMICKELETHTRLEEEIFYPAVRPIASDLISESLEEHKVVKDLISELKGLNSIDEQYEAKFKVLKENVEHHVEEEESEMFPQVEKSLADQLDRLGVEMKNLKDQLSRGTAARSASASY
jgi:uncharacterized protein